MSTPENVPYRHPDTLPVDHQYEVALINEECGEVCQQVGKTLRFGWQSYHPDNPSKTNYDLLHDEMGDVAAAIEFGIERGAFDAKKIAASKKSKLDKLRLIAPPPMHVTRGSVIQRPAENESLAAIWFFVLVLAVIVGVGVLSYHQGYRAAPVAIESDENTLAQECYADKIAAIKDNQPADLSECDALVLQGSPGA